MKYINDDIFSLEIPHMLFDKMFMGNSNWKIDLETADMLFIWISIFQHCIQILFKFFSFR